MTDIQRLLVLIYGIISLTAFVRGYIHCKYKHNRHGITPFGLLGIFIWTDAVVIGLFWMLASMLVLIIDNWHIGLLIISLFWVVRSAGEVIYWMLQQFATKKRDEPETVRWHSLFPGESVWIAQQVWWQMVLVFSLLATVICIKEL